MHHFQLYLTITIIIQYTSGTQSSRWKNMEDRWRTTPQIIASRGYIPEVHEVISQGYILTIHRIVNPLQTRRGKPVMLMHGFLDSSAGWVIQNGGGDLVQGQVTSGVKNMLGFDLARRGYDVWMANQRGNTYSRRHVTLSADCKCNLRYFKIGHGEIKLLFEHSSQAVLGVHLRRLSGQ